jgi:hypothetical protein
MAFPQVAAQNNGNEASATTSHTVNLPASIVSGNLLLVQFTVLGDGTVTWPAGWTSLYDVSVGAGEVTHSVRFRRADGGEGATITLTTSVSGKSSHLSSRITGHHTSTDPEVGTVAEGDSTAPDPPSLSPSWGAEDTLWFAEISYDTGADTTAYPTNYTNGRVERRAGESDSASTAEARRELNASSDDPDALTLQFTRDWTANLIAIRPAGAAGVTVPVFDRYYRSMRAA